MAGLDAAHRRVVTAITANIHTVQALHLHPGADKHGALAALVATAHDQNHHVLALSASPAARDYAAAHRYADAGGHLDSSRTALGNKPLDLPLGTRWGRFRHQANAPPHPCPRVPPARSAALKPTSAAAFSVSPTHNQTGARVSPSE